MARINSNELKNFLVRMGEAMFYAGFDKTWKPLAVAIPSMGLHMGYARADLICQHLIEKGYAACVCDRYGRPADLDIISSQMTARF